MRGGGRPGMVGEVSFYIYIYIYFFFLGGGGGKTPLWLSAVQLAQL